MRKQYNENTHHGGNTNRRYFVACFGSNPGCSGWVDFGSFHRVPVWQVPSEAHSTKAGLEDPKAYQLLLEEYSYIRRYCQTGRAGRGWISFEASREITLDNRNRNAWCKQQSKELHQRPDESNVTFLGPIKSFNVSQGTSCVQCIQKEFWLSRQANPATTQRGQLNFTTRWVQLTMLLSTAHWKLWERKKL